MKISAFFGLLAMALAFGFIGCDNEEAEVFTSSIDETISNDINTLGLVGTSVSSSDVNIAAAEISSGKIKITSAGSGSAVITVSDSAKNAAINVTVSKNGTITIGIINKYKPNIFPEPEGVNELGGKSFITSHITAVFNTDNTYSLSLIMDKTAEKKLIETGNYSWNSLNKTVTTAAEKVMSQLDGELSEKEELKKSYLEYFNSLDPSLPENQIPPDYTLERHVDEMVDPLFDIKLYYYEIVNAQITSFSRIKDTGTAIAGCSYSQKAASDSGGTHYLLSILFDEALEILISVHGQPKINYNIQSHSALMTGQDWVILEASPYGDIRLHKSVSGKTTTKGWN